MPFRTSLVAGLILTASLLSLSACDGAAGDMRPWKPEDHDVNANANQVSGSAAPGEEQAMLIAITWRQNCARCHGPGGRGDGPEGRMIRTPDLSRPDFQSRNSDADIANVIKKGRNKMPGFETLPTNVIDGLVRHVRRLGGR
jgi:mono/diheme cytochrome c family protein